MGAGGAVSGCAVVGCSKSRDATGKREGLCRPHGLAVQWLIDTQGITLAEAFAKLQAAARDEQAAARRGGKR